MRQLAEARAQQAALQAAAAEQERRQAALEEQLSSLKARKHDLVLQLKQVGSASRAALCETRDQAIGMTGWRANQIDGPTGALQSTAPGPLIMSASPPLKATTAADARAGAAAEAGLVGGASGMYR